MWFFVACLPGTSQSLQGQTSCPECAPGSFAATGGAKSCNFCGTKTYTLEDSPKTSCIECVESAGLLCTGGLATNQINFYASVQHLQILLFENTPPKHKFCLVVWNRFRSKARLLLTIAPRTTAWRTANALLTDRPQVPKIYFVDPALKGSWTSMGCVSTAKEVRPQWVSLSSPCSGCGWFLFKSTSTPLDTRIVCLKFRYFSPVVPE